MSGFRLEPYDPLEKRRAIEQDLGGGRWVPCAWVDYDDVGREEADRIASAMLRGLDRFGGDPPPRYLVRWAASRDDPPSESVVEAHSGRQAIGAAIPAWDNDVGWVEVSRLKAET